MRLLLFGILSLCVLTLVSGCTTTEPVWRTKALASLQQLEKGGVAATARPDALRSVQDTVASAERMLRQGGDEEAVDLQFQLACQKILLLQVELDEYSRLMLEQARKKAEAERLRLQEEERARLAALRAAEEERRRSAEAAVSRTPANVDAGSQPQREKPLLPSSYNVRRGESLPQIASRPEIYGEAALWPLIYRANRDQVRDPYQLWPGQILKIPRSYSREEAAEARRQAYRRTP